MRSKHPGGGMHHRCTLAGLPASMAFRWRKSPCRPSLSQKNTALRGRMAQICGKSKKSEQAGAGARVGRHAGSGHASGCDGAGAGARGRGQASGRGGTSKLASAGAQVGQQARAGGRGGAGRPVGAGRRARRHGRALSKAPGEPTSAGFTRRSRPTPNLSASVSSIGTGATARRRVPGIGTRLFPRCCKRAQPELLRKRPKVCAIT